MVANIVIAHVIRKNYHNIWLGFSCMKTIFLLLYPHSSGLNAIKGSVSRDLDISHYQSHLGLAQINKLTLTEMFMKLYYLLKVLTINNKSF